MTREICYQRMSTKCAGETPVITKIGGTWFCQDCALDYHW